MMLLRNIGGGKMRDDATDKNMNLIKVIYIDNSAGVVHPSTLEKLYCYWHIGGFSTFRGLGKGRA
jgi:hypothetical protein